jgi:hypothetical protein
MPSVGFEPTIPVFERAKTVHALDCAATVIGYKKAAWDKCNTYIFFTYFLSRDLAKKLKSQRDVFKPKGFFPLKENCYIIVKIGQSTQHKSIFKMKTK